MYIALERERLQIFTFLFLWLLLTKLLIGRALLPEPIVIRHIMALARLMRPIIQCEPTIGLVVLLVVSGLGPGLLLVYSLVVLCYNRLLLALSSSHIFIIRYKYFVQ